MASSKSGPANFGPPSAERSGKCRRYRCREPAVLRRTVTVRSAGRCRYSGHQRRVEKDHTARCWKPAGASGVLFSGTKASAAEHGERIVARRDDDDDDGAICVHRYAYEVSTVNYSRRPSPRGVAVSREFATVSRPHSTAAAAAAANDDDDGADGLCWCFFFGVALRDTRKPNGYFSISN